MAITTFAELKTALADWSDSGTELDSYTGDFITLATQLFNFGGMGVSPLRARQMVATSDLTPTAGVCTLPTDYLQYRRVVEDASTRRELTYITPSSSEDMYADRAAGLSNHFTIIGSSLYMFPVSTNDIELTYFQKIPELSVSNTTNWLLTAHPGLYLHCALIHLGMFRRDDQLTSRSVEMTNSLMRGLSDSDTLGTYAYAPTRIRRMTVA